MKGAWQQSRADANKALQHFPQFRRKIGVFTETAMGRQTRVRLLNMGITTKLMLRCEMQVDITGAATVSPKAPYNMIKRVSIIDYDNTTRFTCTGWDLFLLNFVRRHRIPNQSEVVVSAFGDLGGNKQPVGVANDQLIEFFMEVPLAWGLCDIGDAVAGNDPTDVVHRNWDLSGAILTQTNIGDCYLVIDWNDKAGPVVANDCDALYTAGTATLDFFRVTAWQEGLLPVTVGGRVPLPLMHLNRVYEINSVRYIQGLQANAELSIPVPNNRSVTEAILTYTNNGTMVAGSISQTRVILNGSTPLREYNELDFAHHFRLKYQQSPPPGVFLLDATDRWIKTNLYGAVEIGFTPAAYTASANTYVDVNWVSFYDKGGPLPTVRK